MKLATPIFLALITIIAIATSCKMTYQVERKHYKANVSHVPREIVKQKQEASYNATAARHILDTIKDDKTPITASNSIFNPDNFEKDLQGRLVAAITAKTVSVKSGTRVLAERDGKVEIDFVITLPRELQGASQSILVTPLLYRKDTTIRLEPIQIRGGLFDLLQQRNYWQYEKFRTRLVDNRKGILDNKDHEILKRVFEQYVRHPYLDQARFDSISSKKETIPFYYTQTVKVAKGENKLQIALEGEINALDGSRFHIPPSDTINFNISTMLFFIDTTTRYKLKIVNKFSEVKDRQYLTFKISDTKIIDTLADNKAQLAQIRSMMDQLIFKQEEYNVDTITMTASASPEGSAKLNQKLSEGRAMALKDYLIQAYQIPELDTLFKVSSIGENWEEYRQIISSGNFLHDKKRILNIIDNEPKLDEREYKIRTAITAKELKYLKDSIYPSLRSVDFKYNLRRKGMLKDTIHTSIVDTQYMEALEDMKSRRYAKAATVLLNYRDMNTAVIMLSLGYNASAYELLMQLPQNETVNYLRAIICSRLGKFAEGLKYYKLACEVDEQWEFRGRLDPEISSLLIDEQHNTPTQ